MDQEVRSSDLLTVLANLMDPHSHGMQSSQNNNNNSNPTHLLRQNAIGADTGSANSEVQASTTQGMNAHILNIPGQASAGTIPVSNVSATDAEIVDIERLSALMNPNFTNASGNVANHNTQDPLYEAASQIGMQVEGNMLDSRLPAYSTTGIDFASSQNQQALLEALNTIDTSTVASLSCAPSYVSLLHQQSGEIWPGQSSIPASGNYSTNPGNKQFSGGNTRASSNHPHGNNLQSSSTLDKSSLPSQDIHASSNKSAMHLQHSSGMQTPNKSSRSNQQYNGTSLQYRQSSKNHGDLVLPVSNDGLPLMNDNENRGKEKKLTTTPIPSDADKSSCGSTSSGSISGPEQSPDHMSEQQSSNTADLNQHNIDDSVLIGGDVHPHTSQNDPRNIRNIENAKNYPCYGNMNLVNFGTINFTPVMDNSHASIPSADVSRNSQDGSAPVPTSDSVIEIDETVTSPLENIPMSPTVMDQSVGNMSQALADFHKMNSAGRGSFTQMQTVSAVHQVRNIDPNLRKSKSRTVESSRRPVNGHKLTDPSGNSARISQDYSKNFASLSTVTQDNLQEKQKKSRSSKHKQSQQRRNDFPTNMLGNEPLQYDYVNVNSVPQASHLKPKVNADPTIRLKQSSESLTHPSLNQFGRQSLPQGNASSNPCLNPSQSDSNVRNTIYSAQNPQNLGGTMNTYSAPGVVQTPSAAGRSHTWQTVTAVQGPKLPPMLSEQDRIPKRGRPSKKMMQQNLKVKKDAAAATAATAFSKTSQNTSASQPLSHVPDSVQPRLPSSNLVSTYTINSNGLMEEITPRPKENRRSKERTQAFLKYLDEIKTSSKQQRLASDAKMGEKEKGDTEKQKKRSRPRTKVFGRQVSQPLTESGITETMYTFSALAHQFKISSSIVERATENLLKAAAMKRNKEQQNSTVVGQNQRFVPDKNNNRNPQPVAQSAQNKGVSLVSSHCERNATITTTTASSDVPNVPTIKLPTTSTLKKPESRQLVPTNTLSEIISPDKVVRIRQDSAPPQTMISSTIGPKVSADSAPAPPRPAQKEASVMDSHQKPEITSNVLDIPISVHPESVSDSDQASSKGKHKKKKHKKHKKHKYPDSSSGKKKKKDKDRKKKSKKKPKSKPTPSITPSSSVSLVKPATRPAISQDVDNAISMKPDAKISTPSTFSTCTNMENFSSGFRQTNNTDLDGSSWLQEDNTYDPEDSSSDEASASPKSNADTAIEINSSNSTSSSNQSLFAQYSNSRIGFGTFSIPAPKSSPDVKAQQLSSTSVSASVASTKDTKNSPFSSQNLVRSDKKHSKHKKKKFFRKSKTCDPAFAALLDELLKGMKELQLASNSKTVHKSRSTGNIFFSTSTIDMTQSLLWRSPTNSASSQKAISSSTKSASFPKHGRGSTLGDNRIGTSRKTPFGLNKSKSSLKSKETEVEGESLSVFCRAPFFQKYGYITKSQQSLLDPLFKTKKTSPAASKDNNYAQKVPIQTTRAGDKKSSVQINTTITQLDKKTKESENVIDVVALKEKEEQPSQPPVKRKRGWPRGKPRGPRAKKANISKLTSPPEKEKIELVDTTLYNKLEVAANPSKPKTSGSKDKPSKEVEKSSSDNQESNPGPSTAAMEALPTEDLSKIVNDSLLQQIKQAIEANLPKHVNKDAITKSVDAAVQSYLQNMTKTSPQTGPASEEPETIKRKPGRRRSRNTSVESSVKIYEETSPKANTDIHPKKLWACKHQDTESSAVSKSSDTSRSAPIVIKKRGPGRPRKNPLPDPSPMKQTVAKLSSAVSKQGKVPTASATVVPSKRRFLTVRLGSKPVVKPTVKRLIARAKNDFATRTSQKTPTPPVSTVISKEAANSCLGALCSLKAAKVLAKSGDKDGYSEQGLYSGTQIEMHIAEAISTTVEMYHWDRYRQFEDACHRIEKEMGFVEEFDSTFGDNRPKTPGIKKSIESVVEKLKNKQAQSMHSAATALLELQGTASTSSRSSDENIVIIENRNADNNEKYRLPSRWQEIYEKVSSYKKDTNQSSKLHKVKTNTQTPNTLSTGVPVKRPRGRPRKHPIPVETEIPAKKQKINVHDKLSDHVSESKKDPETPSNRPKLQKSARGVSTTSDTNDPNLSPRKPFISAGLYSSTFKKDPKSSHRQSFGDLSSSRAKLPAPFDAGLFLRSTLKDFQLPYDIWWMYRHEKISPSQDPSTNYIEITESVYTSPRPTPSLSDHICNCVPTEGENCGKGCINRVMFIECQSESCPCAQSCTNQMIQRGRWCDSLERFKTKDRGWGVKTTKTISEGSFILEYVGEVVSETEFRIRTIEMYHAYKNHYCVQLDASTVIDGYRMANEGRFVNHSCDPNCVMQKWSVNGEHRIGLFALRHIHANEELTYDYNFHAYNISMQQECRCGSQKCRSVIGGRTQRSLSTDSDASNPSTIGIKQQKAAGKQTKLKSFKPKGEETTVKEFSILQMKPISKKDKEMIRSQQLFLLRNLAQVRRKEEEQRRKIDKKSGDSSSSGKSSGHKSKPRKSHPSKEESGKVEAALTEMYTAIATCKDQNGVSVAIPFMNLPSKKKNPEYYKTISDPIDLSIIERNIVSNHYKDIETFNNDVQRVFKNAEKYHGRKSTLGKDVFRLRKAYANARGAAMLLLNGHKKPTKSSEVSDEDLDEADENIHRKNEDHIRCICCIYKDEGLMVQCEKCYVWQHCDCMGMKPDNTDRYLCEECDPRPCSKEVKVIPPPPNTPPGHTYYLTLLRDDLLVKQGDCAYLMRDHRLRHNSNSPSVRASHRNLATIPPDKLDIFRVEQLWTDEGGDKYAYGYHFLRPHETHHAPSRTFYHNELFASPFYEIIPLEAVVGLCCVMDLYTYCKGKPKEYKMCDIYVCDYRIDKAAGCFTRITKKRYPICTKPHVFDTYKHKLCPKKDFQPHHVPEQYRKSAGRPPSNGARDDDIPEFLGPCDELRKRRSSSQGSEDGESLSGFSFFDRGDVGSPMWRKRQRLDGIANKLLSKLPKQAVDISYLLDPGSGKRQRKKTQLSLESLSQQK